jgi:flavodoxin
MDQDEPITRREGLKSALLLGMTASIGLAADRANAQAAPGSGSILVAYFTRTGNTRVIARQIRRARSADIFEIQPAEPYPEDYEETVAQATRERESGFEPPLSQLVPNVDRYQTVFLGFPIWGMSAPSVIRSFLSRHDLSGKTVVPFITHGGYGLGQSLGVVRQHAPRARLLDAFSMEADQERRTVEQVTGWLGGVQIPG